MFGKCDAYLPGCFIIYGNEALMQRFMMGFVASALLLASVPTGHAQSERESQSESKSHWAVRFDQAMARYQAGDYAQAFPEFVLLADLGLSPAQTMVAVCYRMGHGVAADPSQAALWFLRAAQRGHAPAQLALVDIFLKGDGLTKDPAEAYKWLLLLVQRAEPSMQQVARARLALLDKQISNAQRQAGINQARRWQPILNGR
jgi:TPR repeat protein